MVSRIHLTKRHKTSAKALIAHLGGLLSYLRGVLSLGLLFWDFLWLISFCQCFGALFLSDSPMERSISCGLDHLLARALEYSKNVDICIDGLRLQVNFKTLREHSRASGLGKHRTESLLIAEHTWWWGGTVEELLLLLLLCHSRSDRARSLARVSARSRLETNKKLSLSTKADQTRAGQSVSKRFTMPQQQLLDVVIVLFGKFIPFSLSNTRTYTSSQPAK